VGLTISIEGTARTPAGAYPVSSLTAKILCTKHNTQLSDLDSAAAYAFRKMREFQTDMDASAVRPQSESATLDGSALERWILKLTLGLLAAQQLRNSALNRPILSVRQGYELRLLKVLFFSELWPCGWGMYLDAAQGQNFAAPTTADGSTAEIGVEPQTNPEDGTLWGLRMWFRSFGWLLTLGSQITWERRCTGREDFASGGSGSMLHGHSTFRGLTLLKVMCYWM
jgi:hypothetical protein